MIASLPGRIVIIGIGNLVRSDDGLGVHAVRRLRQRGTDLHDVDLIDGETAGLMLLPHLADAQRAIIVDAISVGEPPGTLVRLDRAEGIFATGMTPHDVGLADLLDAMRLTATTPDELVLHGLQPGSTDFGTELTGPVAAMLDALVDAIDADLKNWRTHDPRRAGHPAAPFSPAAQTALEPRSGDGAPGAHIGAVSVALRDH